MSEPRAELQEILGLTRDFALAELRPRSEAWDRERALPDAIMAQLAELGFLGMVAPEQAGGMALDPATMLATLAELARGEASAALAVALHTQVTALVARASADGARDRWLPALAAGELIGCAPAASAGPATVRAERAGDGWVLEGAIEWVGNARAGGVLAVVAMAAGIARLGLVKMADPGVMLDPPVATLGLYPLALRTVRLEGVRLAENSLLWPDEVPAAELSTQRLDSTLAVAAVATGIAQAALDHARDYANEREQFGCKLRQFEGIRHMLADMAIRVAASHALLARAAAEPEQWASLAKVAAADNAMAVSTQAVQVFGGYGYMRDYPVEKLMRDARGMALLGGSDDLQRQSIAEQLYQV